MRVTNSMTTNTLLLNLNRNMTQLSKLQYQASTGNKIQYASDDPIIAGRALKFRTNVSETEQYIKNAEQATSWLMATENAMNNVKEIMLALKELNVQVASGTLTVEDKQKISTDMSELSKQLSSDMNAQYAGRYIFSGFKTDEPATFTKDQHNKMFDITQEFSKLNVEKSFVYTRDPDDITKIAEKKEISRIQLAYRNIDEGTLTVNNLPEGYSIVTKGVLDNDAYDVAENTINYIEETGELILPEGFYTDLGESSFSVVFTKTGFVEGDLNPVNYFNCVEHMQDCTTKNYTTEDQAFRYEVGTNIKMQINSLSKDILSVSLKNDLDDIINFVSSITPTNEADLREALKAKGLSASEIDDEVKTHLSEENKIFQSTLYEKFNILLSDMEKHSTQISKEHTMIGARLDRLEFVENRLRDDELNFTELRDNNELADVSETLIKYNAQLAVYQSSLSIGAQIMQKTLVDFIR